MNDYVVQIDSLAKLDIQEGINWYNNQAQGLGRKFHLEIKDTIDRIKLVKFFQIRYDEVRCLPTKKFPYMIHFTIDDNRKLIIIRAVLNTHLDPQKWDKRK